MLSESDGDGDKRGHAPHVDGGVATAAPVYGQARAFDQ